MPTTPSPFRLWPGVTLVLLLLAMRFAVPAVAPPDLEVAGASVGFITTIGSLACALGIALWWLLLSRAAWSDRVGALLLMALAVVTIRPLTHISIQNGMMGMMFFIYAIPVTLSVAFVAAAVLTRHWAPRARRVAMAAAIVAGCAGWTAVRTDGIISGGAQLAWRWTPTAEARLLARGEALPIAAPAAPSSPAEARAAGDHGEATTANEVPETAARRRPADDDARAEAPVTSGNTGDEARTPDPAPAAGPETRAADSPEPVTDVPGIQPTRVGWPGFRGAARDGVVRGTGIETDWAAAPPMALWRRPIGPGWSSFAVGDGLIYTQEQRGDHEVVSCYRLATGAPVWHHRETVRFWESNGGAGPRATPTLHDGRVYAFGATGLLNALDAATGARLWTRDVAADTGRQVPGWGFASSPLVIDDVVIVAAAGTLAAYDRAGGTPRWQGPSYGGSYSSPHRVVIDGVEQVVLLGGPGAIAVDPATGEVLWTHEWTPGPMVQPAVLPDGDLLINAVAMTGGAGTRRLRVTRDGDTWRMTERWTTTGLKPYFNDFVVHGSYAYGFDGNILAAIDLTDGRRVWKGGRYGNGQMILLPDQDLLLVVSEEGGLALVSATPDKYTEIARAPALDAKTWNHPVLVGDTLLVRNGEEMAAFRLTRAALTSTR